MKVMRCRGPTSRAIIEDHPPGPKIGHEPEKCLDVFRDDLAAMVHMGNREVGSKYWRGIAEDQEFVSTEDSILVFRETIQAKETAPVFHPLFADVGSATLDSPGIVLNANGKSVAGNVSLSAFLK
jgi:hypothetical protein